MFESMIKLHILENNPFEDRKGSNPFSDQGDFSFKKCCKKYKDGKRCKKCPGRK